MNRVQPHLAGAGLGILVGSWHVIWALLVWLGAAQWLIDPIFRLHMITPPYQIAPFSFPTAVGLVLVTASIGYLAGLFIGVIWNRCVLRPARG